MDKADEGDLIKAAACMLVDLTPRAIPVPLPGKIRAARELHERKPGLAGEAAARRAEAQGPHPP